MKKFIVKKRTHRKPVFKNIPMGSSLQVSELETDKVQQVGDFVFFKDTDQKVQSGTIRDLAKEIYEGYISNITEEPFLKK